MHGVALLKAEKADKFQQGSDSQRLHRRQTLQAAAGQLTLFVNLSDAGYPSRSSNWAASSRIYQGCGVALSAFHVSFETSA